MGSSSMLSPISLFACATCMCEFSIRCWQQCSRNCKAIPANLHDQIEHVDLYNCWCKNSSVSNWTDYVINKWFYPLQTADVRGPQTDGGDRAQRQHRPPTAVGPKQQDEEVHQSLYCDFSNVTIATLTACTSIFTYVSLYRGFESQLQIGAIHNIFAGT